MRVSPTQLATHRACARRYAWEYVQDRKPGPTPAMARGTAIHAILEDYLNGKGPIDATTEYGAIAQAGVQYLPEPGEGKAEVEFTLTPVSSHPFVFFGKIDYLSPSRVIDHKTTSDFRYVKPVETLRVDPQAVLYAAKGYDTFPRFTGDIRYIYYLTAKRKTAQARPVDFTLTKPEVTDRFAEVSAEAEKLYQIRTTKPDPLSLPPNLAHCNDYEGCPHRALCTDLNSTEDIIRRIMLPGKDDLLGRLMAEATGTVPPPASTAPVASPVQQLQNVDPSAKVQTDEPDEEAQLLAQLEQKRAEKKAKAELEEKARLAAEAAAKAKEEADKKALSEITVSVTSTKEETKTEEKPKGRGRPPGSKNKPKEGEAPVVTGVRPIAVLYVDCLPVGEEVFYADAIFALVREKVTEALKVPHYKLVDYGKGTGIWSEAVREYCETNLKGDNVFVDSRTLEGADALSALCQCAATIVRGLR